MSTMKTMPTLEELNRRFGISGLARVCEGNGGLSRIQITSSKSEGEIYLHGAQVTSWKPAGNDEVLFLSAKARWEDGQAIRGGIPICFPWFRAKVDDPKAPAHGVVRTKRWQLDSIAEQNSGTCVTMSTQSDDETRRWWPAEFRLVYRVTFGSELTLELSCTNIGQSHLRFEEALHTYNRVANVANVRLQGLNTAHFLDNTDSNTEKMQDGDLKIAAQTDKAFLGTGDNVDLIDPELCRQVRLKKTNSKATVVWNPWREGVARFKDLADGEWTKFLCVEASNILSSSITLAPRAEHKMTAVLSVAKL